MPPPLAFSRGGGHTSLFSWRRHYRTFSHHYREKVQTPRERETKRVFKGALCHTRVIGLLLARFAKLYVRVN